MMTPNNSGHSSKTPHTCIVGGGLAGITAALLAAQQGHQVTLIDRAPALGAQWDTITTPDGVIFTQGVRIPEVSRIAELDSLLFGDLTSPHSPWHVYDGPLKEGSLFCGKRNDTLGVIDATQLPDERFHAGLFQLLQSDRPPHESGSWANAAQQASDIYGAAWTQHIYEPLIQHFTGLSLSQLAVDGYKTFLPQRLCVGNATMAQRLQSYPLWAQKIAHASWTDMPSCPQPRYIYPKTGESNAWVDFLKQQLQTYGVRLLLGYQVYSLETHHHSITGITVTHHATPHEPETLPVDRFVWTLPTAMLYPLLNWTYEGDRPPMRDLALVYLALNGPVNTNAAYVNNFDVAHAPFRITFLDNLITDARTDAKHNRIVAEVYGAWDTPEATQALAQSVQSLLYQHGYVDERHTWGTPHVQWCKNFRPMHTPTTAAQTQASYEAVSAAWSNLVLTGRAASNAYLTWQVFQDVYHKMHINSAARAQVA